MDRTKQFETMTLIRAYAKKIVDAPADDQRPSTAHQTYRLTIVRMHELQKSLDCVS